MARGPISPARSLPRLESAYGARAVQMARSAAQSSTPSEYLIGRDALAIAAGPSRIQAELAGDSFWPASKSNRFIRSRPFDVEDNRSWSPETPAVYSRPYKLAKPYRMFRTTPAKIRHAKTSVVKPNRRGTLTASGVQFSAPSYVILCIRRKRRRAAIMASGRGGGKHKRARFNYSSQIWC